jgi:polyisoprenoid-binding protein YceI
MTPGSIPASGAWKIDPVHSTANFSVPHNVVARFRAQFPNVTGTLEGGVLNGLVEVEGLHLGLPMLREHLLSAGFLDMADCPTLSFSSTDLHAHDDGTVHLNGELTIKGVTKAISAAGTVTGPARVTKADGSEADLLALDLTTTIDRRDFGLGIEAGTGWDVTIDVSLELNQA